MKKFEFAKFYDITDVAKEYDAEYDQYEKVFLCVDTWDFWIARILKGWANDDEEGYIEDEDNYLVERINIAKVEKMDGIESLMEIHAVLKDDFFENYDTYDADSLEDAIEILDGGYGIGKIEYENETV